MNYITEKLPNNIPLRMIEIPGGTFLMGSPETEEGHKKKEAPQHQVTVQSFWMGKYPVTQAQWKAVWSLLKSKRDMRDLLTDPCDCQGSLRPVDEISINEATEFCDRLSELTGKPYRLPSEAEWEYACRAGTTTPFSSPNPSLETMNCKVSGNGYNQTTNVNTFTPNKFDLFDVHGNIGEWCSDHWHDNYEGAPTDGSAWMDQELNRCHVVRGGTWFEGHLSCRSASRRKCLWNLLTFGTGLRVAYS